MPDIPNVGLPAGVNRITQTQKAESSTPVRGTRIQEEDTSTYDNAGLVTQGPPSTPDLSKPDDVGNLTQLLLQVRMKLNEVQVKLNKEGIKANSLAQKALNDKRLKAILDAIKQMEKSKKAGLFGQIFGWVSAAALTIAGAALMLAGGAGAPILAAGLIGLTMMTLQQTGAMDKITSELAKGMTKLFEDFGMSKDTAKQAGQIAAQVAIAVVVIGATAAVTLGTGGGGAAAELSQLQKLANLASLAARGIGGLATVGSGAASIATGVYQFQATNFRADATEDKKKMMQLQAIIQQAIADLQKLMTDMQADFSKVAGMIKSHAGNMQMITRDISA